MLVIISDLHLTDGTSGQTIKENAFNIFAERVREMALAASFRQDDTYKPVKKVDILLLGDILDVIRSTTWLKKDETVRPWSEPLNEEVIETVACITGEILEHNKASLNHLKKLSKKNGLKLYPPNETNTAPDYEKCEEPVEVKIHYMVGNHDWFYHLPDGAYNIPSGACNSLRERVVEAMGLANDPKVGFPHDPDELDESDELRGVLDEHQVFARHGDIYDSFNFDGDRDRSSLGDCIVIELLNRFPSAVKKIAPPLSSGNLDSLLDGLRELDNVRPLLAIPIWIDTLLKKTKVSNRQIREVKNTWDNLVDKFLDLKFVTDRDSFFNPFDNADKLQIALKFSKGISLRTAGALASWWNEQIGVDSDSYYSHAVKEEAFKNRRERYIVYGHTHDHEIVPLDVSLSGDERLDQMYFNAGTWRRVHRLAKGYPNEQEFIAYDVMTYLSFFKGTERKGRPFATWSGALGEKRQASVE